MIVLFMVTIVMMMMMMMMLMMVVRMMMVMMMMLMMVMMMMINTINMTLVIVRVKLKKNSPGNQRDVHSQPTSTPSDLCNSPTWVERSRNNLSTAFPDFGKLSEHVLLGQPPAIQ